MQTIKTSRVYSDLCAAHSYRTVVMEGGARSGKSRNWMIWLLFEKLLKVNNFRYLMLRKVRHSMKTSSYERFIDDVLKPSGIYKPKNHNMSELTYSIPETGASIRFSGMDDFGVVKSTGWYGVGMEEADEFEKQDYLFLKTRVSESSHPQIHLAYNPNESWIQDLETDPRVKFFFYSYKDNPFLSPEYIEELESLKSQNPEMYQIYALGKRARRGGTIYPEYTVIETFPELDSGIFYGLDFGFENPSALLRMAIREKDLFVEQSLFERKLTNEQLMERCKVIIPDWKRAEIVADSEAPDRIQEFYDSGFRGIKAVAKGKGSVCDGIDVVKRHRIHITQSSADVLREIKRYQRKKDKSGNFLEDPVKYEDHSMDAMRYGVMMQYRDRPDYRYF
jgi:phage terminase large subunit